MAPDILLAGHIVKDIVSGGWQPGGGVTYGSAQARRLGLSVAALTSCDKDVRPSEIVPDVEWRVVDSDTSTVFENRYAGHRREQRVLSHATPLVYDQIPSEWLPVPLALITPVYQEVEVDFATHLKAQGTFVGLAPQGWLRRLVNGRVLVDRVEPAPNWLHGDVVFVSEEDVVDPDSVALWLQRVPIVVLTRARLGCKIWEGTGRQDVAAFETVEVDPTGAGDVFAVAFLVRLRETGDVREAGLFGCAAAALSVRGRGLSGIGDREQIEALMRRDQAVRAR